MPSTYISTLSLHDALPIYLRRVRRIRHPDGQQGDRCAAEQRLQAGPRSLRSEEHTSELQSHSDLVCRLPISPLFPYTTLFRSTYEECAEYATLMGNKVIGVPLNSDFKPDLDRLDRKSTRLNSSHTVISYAVYLYLHSFPTRRSSDLPTKSAPNTPP